MNTRALVAGIAAIASLLLPAPAVAGGPSVVLGGLNNPRGLAFGPDGSLYVAEAGAGGTAPCFSGPEGGEVCFGRTGSLTRFDDGKQSRVLKGLPSIAGPGGNSAIGPSDVSFAGIGYLTMGLGAEPAMRELLPAGGDKMGKLFAFLGGKKAPALTFHEVADIAGFEASTNPDGSVLDTNPQGVLAFPGNTLVVDAGGNALLKTDDGIKTQAVFPDHDGADAVPTAVAYHRGAFYISELTGFPFQKNTARIYKWVPGKAPVTYVSGLTNVIDLAFDDHGNLYVLEIAHEGLLGPQPSGALLKIRPGKTPKMIASGLMMPGGLAIEKGSAYISDCGTCAGSGRVLRVKL